MRCRSTLRPGSSRFLASGCGGRPLHASGVGARHVGDGAVRDGRLGGVLQHPARGMTTRGADATSRARQCCRLRDLPKGRPAASLVQGRSCPPERGSSPSTALHLASLLATVGQGLPAANQEGGTDGSDHPGCGLHHGARPTAKVRHISVRSLSVAVARSLAVSPSVWGVVDGECIVVSNVCCLFRVRYTAGAGISPLSSTASVLCLHGALRITPTWSRPPRAGSWPTSAVQGRPPLT